MSTQTAPHASSQARLILLTCILFFSYICIGISLPVVPIHVTGQLHLGNAWAGLAVGTMFFATIATRGYAGHFSDRFGAKRATLRGLACYVIGALVSALSGMLAPNSLLAFSVLVVGRLALGVGESLVAVGVISWGISLVGPANSGRVLAMVGAAIYGALALGGPIGLTLLEHFGFSGAMSVSALLSGLGMLTILPLAGAPAHPDVTRPSLTSVVKQIWQHGAIVCLQGIGFAAIGAFFALYFRAQEWSHAGFGLTAFGVGFVLVRLFLGHLPDRMGALQLAIASLAVEAIGQALIWTATSPAQAFVGAFMTGLGCSLIFPAMGREVVHLVAPHLRGTALGGFSAFQDIAYGLTGPLAGYLADRAGYGSVFLAGGCAAVVGVLMAMRLLNKGRWLENEVYGSTPMKHSRTDHD